MFGSRRARAQKRVTALARDIAAARARLGVLEEQVAFLEQVESDAQTDAVVTGDPREHRSARSDLERARRERQEVIDRIARLGERQDQLLEGLLD